MAGDDTHHSLFVREPRVAAAAVAAFLVALLVTHVVWGKSHMWIVGAVATIIIAVPYAVEAWDTRRQMAAEFSIAGVLVVLAIAGVLGWPGFIVLALVIHAGWDWVKHSRHAGVKYLSWYPPVCAPIDLTYAVALLVAWLV